MIKKKSKYNSKTSSIIVDDIVSDLESKPEKEVKENVKKVFEKVFEKAVEAPVELEKPLVSLKVFCLVSGQKWDQIAGFRSYATSNKLGPFSVLDWRVEFQKFQNKPTKQGVI